MCTRGERRSRSTTATLVPLRASMTARLTAVVVAPLAVDRRRELHDAARCARDHPLHCGSQLGVGVDRPTGRLAHHDRDSVARPVVGHDGQHGLGAAQPAEVDRGAHLAGAVVHHHHADRPISRPTPSDSSSGRSKRRARSARWGPSLVRPPRPGDWATPGRPSTARGSPSLGSARRPSNFSCGSSLGQRVDLRLQRLDLRFEVGDAGGQDLRSAARTGTSM